MKKLRPTNRFARQKPVAYLLFLALCVLGCNADQEQKMKNPTSDTKQTEKVVKQTENEKKRIVFFGNSLTAGYGLNEDQAFTTHIQYILDSLNLPYEAVNAGLSGETTAGGVRRIDWILKQPMSAFVLELGGNDMLRGFGVDVTEENLRSIIQKVRAKHPTIPIILAGMMAPPNMGEEYTKAYGAIFPRLAKEMNLELIPFFLKDVGGIPELNLQDGIHPNADGQKIVAKNVWTILKTVI